MNYKTLFPRVGTCALLGMVLMGGLSACQDDLDELEHYKSPDFLVGNAIEVLKADGNYKTFLRGIELIGYNDVVNTQLLTVLAPTDEAFTSYLKGLNYASIEEMYYANPELTREMITYHLLYYAMDWDKMTNFRPTDGDGATDTQKAVMAGMYNRYRTRCTPAITKEYNAEAGVQTEVSVVHYDRYLTVFSAQMFHTLGIDAKTNYEYFFPGTKWNPNNLSNGFNVMNAAVLDKEAVVTDNGYLYHIDHVLEPLGTIYEELQKDPKYSKFLKFFTSRSIFEQDQDQSKLLGINVFAHKFSGLPDIGIEWYINDYQAYSQNTLYSYNLIAPTNDALDKLFSEFWQEGCGYNSVEELDPLIQSTLLDECFIESDITGKGEEYRQTMCFPQMIDNNRACSRFGTPVTTKSSEFDAVSLANNGTLFGATSMKAPGVFASVAGPAFMSTKYQPYLYVLNGAKRLEVLASNASQFVVLVPDTFQFTHNTPKMRLEKSTTSGHVEYTLQQWNDEASAYSNIGSGTLSNMALMHTSTDATELKTEGTQVVETSTPFNYWFIRDGKITTNALFNQQLNPTFADEIWYPFHEIYSDTHGSTWSNGRAYAYEYPGVYSAVSGNSLETELATCADKNYPYYCFSQLLRLAGLAAEGRFVENLALDPTTPRFIALIPTNEAIRDNIKKMIPGFTALSCDASFKITGNLSSEATRITLANYLMSYFIKASVQPFAAYPYLGSSCKGDFPTGGAYDVRITDNGTSLSVTAIGQNADGPYVGTPVPVVSTYGYLPFAFSDGGFQLIDGVVK